MPLHAPIPQAGGLPSRLIRSAAGLVAVAMLLQALLGLPLAVRMAAQADTWLQGAGAVICSHADDGVAADQPASPAQPASHHHCPCPICQPAPALLGPSAAASVEARLAAGASERVQLRADVPPAGTRYSSHRSRAPPSAA